MDKKQKYIAAILGHIVADALGVPVEFNDRLWLKENPVTDMIGYGTHSQPAGTWSDDSSMTVATLEWLGEIKNNMPNYAALMDKFCAWIYEGEYTPYGVNFDNGIATARAIMNYRKSISPLECGGRADYDNGNGSLMRILPVALYCAEALAKGNLEESARFIYDVSSLTHAHARSKVGCLIYAKIVADLLFATENGDGTKLAKVDKVATVQRSLSACKAYLESISDKELAYEKEKYERLWDLSTFKCLPEDEIQSSGYVLHTLEAAVWCFLNTDNYKDCVLKAVNLGDDTDTVGAVAGGLAGLHYGLDAIPKEWIALIPKREWIVELIENI